MAKKKKGKVVQMLSPENYIRQKARNLPVYECRLNSNWKESGLAHITIARKHTNGNITMGLFLIDLKLLGVKDAFYRFNISELEYREIIEDQEEQMDLEKVSYTLVHNIIFAGIEFADDYGFKPHKDFTSVAQYILEEDTDEFELIEIECGEDDKPVYVRGPLDSETRAKQIIAQLEREAGPGNYEVVWQSEKDFMEDGSWNDDTSWLDDDVDEIEEKYENLSTDEKVDLIANMFIHFKELSDVQSDELAYLTNSVINSYLDYDLLNSLSTELSDKLLEYEITEEYTDELLGIEPDSDINREKWKDQFSDLYNLAINKPKSAGKKIKKLQKNMPENPALAFLEVLIMQSQNSVHYEEKLESYHEQFPNYPLINIFWGTHHLLKNENANPIDYFKKGAEKFFAGRESVHHIELFHYLFLLIITASAFANITLIEVVDMIMDEIEIPEEDNDILSEMIAITKMNFILSLKEEAEAKPQKGNKKSKETETFQFKIQIKGITKPPVWRRVTVPSGYSFYDFHRIIQEAFGWWSSHLFQFSEKGFDSHQVITEIYEDLDPGFDEQFDAREIILSDVFKTEKQKFVYIYDFGDDWEHNITLEKILPEKTMYPSLLAGKGQCPPEDCGGVWGYESFKEIMADKNHPEYKEFAEWCGLEDGEKWDPNEFDLKERQNTLKKMFKN